MLKLRVLGKFLGYLHFQPYHHIIGNINSSLDMVSIRNNVIDFVVTFALIFTFDYYQFYFKPLIFKENDTSQLGIVYTKGHR